MQILSRSHQTRNTAYFRGGQQMVQLHSGHWVPASYFQRGVDLTKAYERASNAIPLLAPRAAMAQGYIGINDALVRLQTLYDRIARAAWLGNKFEAIRNIERSDAIIAHILREVRLRGVDDATAAALDAAGQRQQALLAVLQTRWNILQAPLFPTPGVPVPSQPSGYPYWARLPGETASLDEPISSPPPREFVARVNQIMMADPELAEHPVIREATAAQSFHQVLWDSFQRMGVNKGGWRMDQYRKVDRIADKIIKQVDQKDTDPYNLKWSRSLTGSFIKAVSNLMASRGYKVRTVPHGKSSKAEVDVEFISNRNPGIFSLTTLADHSWIFDVNMNGMRMPLMVMNFSRYNQPGQGVPPSMGRDNWDGMTLTAGEGRLYQQNLRRIFHWLNQMA